MGPLNQVRVVEWSLLGLLIVALIVTFLHKSTVMQRQAEVATVQSTLGALRTAFVIDHLQRQARHHAQDVAVVQRNPFQLLQQRPRNYWGEATSADMASVPPGNWVFDAHCACVGYLPTDAAELVSPSGAAVAWYQVTGVDGVFELTAKERYVWRGRLLN
ncbi:MAG: hypothetical protein PHH58_07750 [Rhodoferax sp.]|nr:hypothetical protein [Rhodoferax sp.]